MNAALLTLIAFMLAAPPPLTQTQRIMLEDTADFSPTSDEAGLYALLSNARDWPAEPAQNIVGATVPDFEAIRKAPAEHRGQLFLIEGKLESQIDMGLLSREGYEEVVTLTVRVPRGGVVIVYLTDDPQLEITERIGRHSLPAQRGATVRIGARFFKFIQQPNQDGQSMFYPVYVGRSMAISQPMAAEPECGASAAAVIVPVAVVILMLGAFMIIRKYANTQPSLLEQRRAAREAQLHETQEVEYRDDLPDDPAEAMNALEHEHEDADHDGDR